MQTFDKYVSVDNIHLYATFIFRNETRPTIVFLHDSLGCTTLWRDFPSKLSELTNCNALVYDRQGYGKSQPITNLTRSKNYLELEADLLYKLLAEYKIDDTILFRGPSGVSTCDCSV